MDNPDRITYFAATDSRGKKVPFGLKAKDRQRHMYVIGKTGMGKSTMLLNMAIQDIQNGEGMAFIDPHGSAVEELLEFVPQHRIKDVVYFSPSDLEHPMAFNVMEDVGYDKRHLVVSGLMATFKKLWVDAWSARMEYILTNTLLALLEYPESTLLGVNRMYTDKAYRTKVVDNVKDPVVKEFWLKEFAGMTDRTIAEATPAIQNKIGQFTGNPLIRNIIGQPKSSFDIRELMDQKKILLINLSKGLVGDTNMRLLGSMLTTRIFLAAMSRAELSPGELKKAENFYFYVDEFQNFANDTFSEILSEARKYSLNLIIAHQYVEQMDEQVRAAVFGNVGTSVSFRVGPFDAETLETIFTPEFTKEDLVNLGFAQIYLTLMIDGVGSRPFSAVTLPPIHPPKVNYIVDVLKSSQEQFGNPRAEVEGAILEELMRGYEASGSSDGPKKPPAARPAPSRDGAPAARPPLNREGGSALRPPQNRDGAAPARRDDRPRSQSGTSAPAARRSEGEERRPQQSRDDSTPRSADLRERPDPEQNSKTADDLKAILRTMTAGPKVDTKAGEKGGEATQQAPAPLKNALADVLTRAGGKGAPATPAPRTEAPQKSSPEPKTGPASESAPTRSRAETSAPQPAPERESTPKPYEVPEDTLRSIFNESL